MGSLRARRRLRVALLGLAALLAVAMSSCSSDDAPPILEATIPESHVSGPDQESLEEMAELCSGAFGATGENIRVAIDHDVTAYCLGPTVVSGADIDSAHAQLGVSEEWQVEPVFSIQGIAAFNELASACLELSEPCPTGQVALLVDGFVEASFTPTIDSFEVDQLVFIGGVGWGQNEAEWMVGQIGAAPLNGGAEHPVEVRPVLLLNPIDGWPATG